VSIGSGRLAPSQHHSSVGQEHGRTIPLPDIPPYLQTAAQMLLCSVTAPVCNRRREAMDAENPLGTFLVVSAVANLRFVVL
jgi:hypothetical protein